MKTLKFKTENGYEDLYKVYEKPKPDPFNGYDYVDMGEAGYWATCNVGASKPEEYKCTRFAWGDTVGNKDSDRKFGWSDYEFSNGGSSNKADMIKYNETDGLTVLELEDDAAHVNMGGEWRIPTLKEFLKLYDLCNSEWISNYKGSSVNGMIFKLKTDESKQLFFPACGIITNGSVDNVSSRGAYWSSSLYSNIIDACYLNFTNSGNIKPGNNGGRFEGFSIRGFIPKSE